MGILQSLGSHRPGFVEVLSKVCQSFVENIPQRPALKSCRAYWWKAVKEYAPPSRPDWENQPLATVRLFG